MILLQRFFGITVCLVLAGCASTHEAGDAASNEQQRTFSNAITESEYGKLVENYSVKEEKYSGLYSAYQFNATILNASIQEAQLALKAQDFKWTREVYFAEKEKISESLAKESKIFISFFSPVNENDNLDSNKTIWKIWLVVDGVRYEGLATKSSGILAQHQRLYPYHSRFFTPYVLSFKIPMGKTQASTVKLILTGPIGTSEVEFPPSSQKAAM